MHGAYIFILVGVFRIKGGRILIKKENPVQVYNNAGLQLWNDFAEEISDNAANQSLMARVDKKNVARVETLKTASWTSSTMPRSKRLNTPAMTTLRSGSIAISSMDSSPSRMAWRFTCVEWPHLTLMTRVGFERWTTR